MAKSLIGPAAQQKITTTGISANTIAAGTTAKILQGSKEVLNVQDTFTSDATASAGNIFPGKTAYVNGQKIRGTATSDANIVPGDIKQGKIGYSMGQKIVGIMPPYGPHTIMPITRDQSFGPGVYLAGVITVKGDANLIPSNIAYGTTIFGVTGTYTQAIYSLQCSTVNIGTNVVLVQYGEQNGNRSVAQGMDAWIPTTQISIPGGTYRVVCKTTGNAISGGVSLSITNQNIPNISFSQDYTTNITITGTGVAKFSKSLLIYPTGDARNFVNVSFYKI